MNATKRLLLPKRFVVFMIVLLSMNFGAHSQEKDVNGRQEWKQIRQKEGITVFTRSNPGMDFKEFKSSVIVKGTLDQFLSVLYDIEGLSSWGYNVKSASLISRKADTVQVYYTEAQAPFPY